jgi:hypothetical protein
MSNVFETFIKNETRQLETAFGISQLLQGLTGIIPNTKVKQRIG